MGDDTHQEGDEMAIDTAVQPEVFRLRTPLLKEGRLDTDLIKTNNVVVTMKCYAQGGENELHTHVAEDHIFIILDGQARYWGKDGEIATLGRNEGIFLPAGAFYKFESCGDTPLVLLRVGIGGDEARSARINIHGQPMAGNSKENKHVDPVVIEGAFYE